MAYQATIETAPSSTQILEGPQQDSLSIVGSDGVNNEASKAKDNIRAQAKAQDLTSQVLGFLSTANNDTLVALLVGLGAMTYFVLGRIGLILMGIVIGLVLHATWEEAVNSQGFTHDTIKEIGKTRKQQGFTLLERVLDWREGKKGDDGIGDGDMLGKSSSMIASAELDFSDFPPSTAAALNDLAQAIIRDYVEYGDL
jgi:hypothetical protein